MAVSLSPFAGAGWQFLDANGAPLENGLIHTYAVGSTTPLAAYTTSAGSQANTNPIQLNASGRPTYSGTEVEIWLTSTSVYKFTVTDANGANGRTFDNIPGVASAADLASYEALISSAAGAGNVGFSQSNTYPDETVGKRLKTTIDITDAPFNAVGDGATDNVTAITAAIAKAVSTGAYLTAPTGTYASSSPFEFSDIAGFIGLGDVTLKYTGSGTYCVRLYGGGTAFKYQSLLENFTIEGSGAATQDGLRVEAHPHGIRRNIRVKNVSRSAFSILGDVGSTYDNCIVSGNELAFTTTPREAFFISNATVNATSVPTTICTFINPIAERTKDYGIFIERADCCTFIGGTSESIASDDVTGLGIGVYCGPNSNQNKFYSMFCEANRVNDLKDYGNANAFYGCTFNSVGADPTPESIVSVIVGATATQHVMQDALIWQMTILAGATSPSIVRTYIRNEFVDGNSGVGTFVQGLNNPFATTGYKPSIRLGNTADPNAVALDWYEEGTFTPTVFGASTAGTATYVNQIGRFTRIGNRVTCDLVVNYNTFTGTGNQGVAGLPYTAKATPNLTFVAQVTAQNLTYANALVAEVLGGTTTVMLYSQATAASFAGIAADAAAAIHMTFSYEVA